MAEHASADNDYPEHERTYDGFIRFTIGGVLYVVLICIALLGMTYIGGLAFWAGLFGLIAGAVILAISLVGGLSWTPMAVVIAAVIAMTVVGL